MFKEIFTRLIRHLPSRLVHRDPLPGAQQTVNAVVPPSLSAHCLKMAVMPEEELWKTFDTHPEGLNLAEVEFASEEDAVAFTPPEWCSRDVTWSRE